MFPLRRGQGCPRDTQGFTRKAKSVILAFHYRDLHCQNVEKVTSSPHLNVLVLQTDTHGGAANRAKPQLEHALLEHNKLLIILPREYIIAEECEAITRFTGNAEV
jgi:hypothetical protein